MHTLIIVLTFFISIVLESSFFPYVAIAGIVPNISLILLICYALRNNVEKIVIIGLLAGLVKDVAVGRIIGVSGITFVLMGFFISKYTNKIFPDHLTTPIILTIVGTLFH